MKQKRNFLVGIILGITIAGTLGFLYLPLMTDNSSFLLGFLACLALVSLAFTSFFIWRRQSKTGNATNKNFMPFTLILAGLLIVFLLFKLSEWFTTQAEYHQTQIAQKAELIESTRLSGLVNLMSNVMGKIDDELKDNPKRILSDETIARIAALSYSFKSHLHTEGDTLSATKLSPERGQLLLMISKMNIDSGSLNKIMGQASFSGAVLRDADLRNANLRGADLQQADLHGANLQGANLFQAKLRAANLWGADLNKANLIGADLSITDLRWTNLNETNLNSADLNDADITSAQLRKADLHGANLHLAVLNSANLEGANLEGANMFRATMKKTQMRNCILNEATVTSVNLTDANLTGSSFIKSNLTGSLLIRTILSEAELTGAEMSGIIVSEKNWLMLLNEWNVKGAKEIQSRYKILDQRSKNLLQYRLEKI